jgi:hypothetical protein
LPLGLVSLRATSRGHLSHKKRLKIHEFLELVSTRHPTECEKNSFHHLELTPLVVILENPNFIFLRPENLSTNQEKAIYMTYGM